eukprot:2706939-Pleurochrysis_carterae.AAC.8
METDAIIIECCTHGIKSLLPISYPNATVTRLHRAYSAYTGKAMPVVMRCDLRLPKKSIRASKAFFLTQCMVTSRAGWLARARATRVACARGVGRMRKSGGSACRRRRIETGMYVL